MALRSLNSAVPERRKSMRKTRIPPLPGANDENVDLHWSPNHQPPPSRTSCLAACRPLQLPVCSEPASCNPSSLTPPLCSEASALLSCTPLPSPACNDAALPLSCEPLPSLACCESSSSISCKSSPLRACSEASAFLPPSQDASAEIEYILSEHLPNLTDLDSHLNTLLGRLDSKDWLEVCEALNNMRQLSIYHKASLLLLLDQAVPLLIKAMKNPRSALCKTALMASADLFRAFPEEVLALLEQLLLQLLLKASQDKKFVCEEAERSLEVMTACLPPASLLVQLQPFVTHRNPRVRAKAVSCLYRSVAKLGSESIRSFGFQRLLQIAASQLNDKLPGARESARMLVAEVYAAYLGPNASVPADSVSEEQDWHQFCSAQLSPHLAQAVLRLTSGS
eukprot:c22056_g1_i1 orf=447-1631(-)